jgi:hypothetical protein
MWLRIKIWFLKREIKAWDKVMSRTSGPALNIMSMEQQERRIHLSELQNDK